MTKVYQQGTKKLGVGNKSTDNAGVSMYPDGAAITGSHKRGFLSVTKDTVNFGGRGMNMQFSPQQVKWMGGLMQSTPFPLSLLPIAPPMLPNLDIIKMAVGIGIEVAVMATLFFVSNASDAIKKAEEE